MQKKYEEVIQQAKDALAINDYQAVIQLLAPLCESEVPFEINQLYVRALLGAEQYVQAYQEALTFEKSYLKEKGAFDLWMQVLLNNNLFIPARLALSNHSHDLESLDKQRYLKLIEGREQLTENEQSATITQKLKNFYHIGDQPVWHQHEVLEDADHLPLAKYEQGAQFVLRDPFAHPLARQMVLHTLVDLKDSREVKLRWLDDKEYSIVPKEVDNEQRQLLLDSLYHDLADRLANENPTDYQNFLQLLKLQLLLLYPLESQAIDDPVVWNDVLLSNESAFNDTKHQRAQKWQEKIRNHFQ